MRTIQVVSGLVLWIGLLPAHATDENPFDVILEARHWDHECLAFKEAAYSMAQQTREPEDALTAVDRAIAENAFPQLHHRDLLIIGKLLTQTAGIKSPEEVRRIVGASSICRQN